MLSDTIRGRRLLIALLFLEALSVVPFANITHALADGPVLLTGTDLLTACDGPYRNKFDEYGGMNLCAGYLQGIQQFQHVVTGLREVDPLFCEPKNGNYDQLRRVLVKWLKDNPKDLHREARALVTLAFAKAFPCL